MAKVEIEYKNIKVPAHIHKRLKQQALDSNQTMVDYLSQCLANCKSDRKDK